MAASYASAMLVSLLLSSSGAWACPFCASETGQQIYAGIFDARFVPTLLRVLAPFPVLIGAVALVRRWVPE
jgi:hypothetical protein